MRITLRDYQSAAIESVYTYFATKYGNPLIAMPTGTGKSVVIAGFLESMFERFAGFPQRVLVLTHVKELIKQNHEKLMALWPGAPAGIYSAGLGKRQAHMPITFAGIASIAKKAHLFGRIDIVMIDEAHLVSPSEKTMYRAVLAELLQINPALKVIGLSATPWRLGQGLITDDGIFTDVCFDLTNFKAFNWLIDEGYLSTLVPKPTTTVLDITGIHMQAGEFNQTELQMMVDKDEVTYAALKETVEVATSTDRRHWLIFATGVKHCENIAAMLNTLGISACAVHSKLEGTERDDRIRDFLLGKYTAVVNFGVLTTGFDFPEIDLIVMLRPTASTVLWVQMLGRGTRPVYAPGFDVSTAAGRFAAMAAGPKRDCMVLDFARNILRLGPINDPVIPRKKGKGGGEAPVRLCDQCETYVHASLLECPHCHFKFPPPATKLAAGASTEVLIKRDMEIPIIEYVKVDHITYSVHTKIGAPPMMKVSHYCGMRRHDQFICLQHEGFAHKKARDWWRESGAGLPIPATVEEAMGVVTQLKVATHLKMQTNKKHPEILARCFDGTAFGTTEDQGAPSVDVANDRPAPALAAQAAGADDWDDDVPF